MSVAARARKRKQRVLAKAAALMLKTPLQHKPGCPMLLAVTLPVGIECRHGHDLCPVCDPCTCEVT